MPSDLRHHWLAAALLALPAGAAFGFGATTDVAIALWIATGALAAILTLFEVASRTAGATPARRAYGFAQVVLGADGRFSTSKAVVALWTVLLATALITLSALAWIVRGLTPTNVFGDDWSSLLLLLGGPFASAVLAKGVVSAKTGTDDNAKSVTTAASGSASGAGTVVTTPPSPHDLVTNDSGEIDLVDTQYVIFTLVAVVYFVGAFASRLHDVSMWLDDPARPMPVALLPQIPDALLGLTGLAALTFVGHKAVANQGLRLVRWAPDPARQGEDLVITLVNLPPTATTGTTTVVFADAQGNEDARAPSAVTGQQVTIGAPTSAGSYSVTVSTPGFSAGPHTLTVV